MTSDLDELADNESWGFNNFNLYLEECPKGCEVCSKKDDTCDWKLLDAHFNDLAYYPVESEGWEVTGVDKTLYVS